MSVSRVQASGEIHGSLEQVFQWFYHSENFTASPIVFRSSWKTGRTCAAGAIRDINMIAGWYEEEITEVKENEFIRYRVRRSFPKVIQDFTEIHFQKISSDTVRVDWMIEIEVPGKIGRVMTGPAGRMAAALYGTIIKAAQKEFERRKAS
jgi:uncharacterized membrane protein